VTWRNELNSLVVFLLVLGTFPLWLFCLLVVIALRMEQ
jgi:hypothetical protein